MLVKIKFKLQSSDSSEQGAHQNIDQVRCRILSQEESCPPGCWQNRHPRLNSHLKLPTGPEQQNRGRGQATDPGRSS